ncbi:ABC transporter substrate-binding protein [Paenibacillus albidus]|uniref:ABC transporter substrate-binding protein n=1 Tax=Paenibacillus albidus TaxID=2041023 RepID=A0A917BYA0_9BACL|nr:ABC transporter substrate-binding protein [Paenibacillus albidus]GGF63248.1 ABC transporter substrate-binding protein [Paenibacillus albidus]
MDTNTIHFIRLAEADELSFRLHEPISVTIDSLSVILCCTPRNVKFILRRLEEKSFIRWQPGRGRGHTSVLTFIRSIDEALEDSFQELMDKGKIKEAIELVGFSEVNEPLKERLLSSLNKQMGFHSEADTSSGQDVLRMMRARRLEKLDPAYVYTAFESYLLGQICSTLILYDAATQTFLPGLAHMWECSEDHRIWVFYLRKGVRFHHGRVMTSRDVKETLQRLIDLNSPAIWHYRDIERAEVEGDHCIRFYLSRPNLFFLHLFSCIHMSILPYDVDIRTEIIGTGPYRVSDLNEDVLVLSAFDQYYGIRPHLDRVDIWFVPDHGPGERHYELPGVVRMKLPAERCSTNSIDYPALGCRYMVFNFRKPGYQHNHAFREAIRIVYDQVTLIRELGGNRITPASSFLPWKSSQVDWTASPSLEEARELLIRSGYQGETIILGHTVHKDLEEADWLKHRAAEIGLQIELHAFIEYKDDNTVSTADLIMAEEVLEDDWQWGLINFFKNSSNYLHNYLESGQHSRLDCELESFAQLSGEDRAQLLDRVEGILREQYWILYGCHMNKKAQLNQSLFGLHTAAFGFLDISKLWIKPGFQ